MHRESIITLVRHGETEWSAAGKHTGLTDLPLTAQGQAEADKVCALLTDTYDVIYTSPLKRARETCASLIATPEPLAVEWNYGDYEGLTSWQIQQKNPDWNLFLDGAPNGESPQDVAARADALLEKIAGKNALVFSHGHFLRVLAARFLGLDVEESRHFYLGTASLSKLSFEHGNPVVILWNQVP